MKSYKYIVGILFVLCILATTSIVYPKESAVLQQINFTLLGTDAVDAIPFGLDNDIKSLSISSDTEKDSVYFKIEVYSKLDTFGFYIFFDGDLNAVNGFPVIEPLTPQPFPTPNGSMNFDGRLIYLAKNPLEPSFGIMEWNGDSLRKVGNITYEISDSTIIIGARLSQCDYPETDGLYNFVVISGEPNFGKFIDFIPDDTYFSIGLTDTEVNNNNKKNSQFNIYPNPATDYVYISTYKKESLLITDIKGLNITPFIQTGNDSSQEIIKLNTKELTAGTYLIRYLKDNKYYTNIMTIMK